MDEMSELVEKKSLCLGIEFGKEGTGHEYIGESEVWGKQRWELGIKMLQFASETAMELILNEGEMNRNNYNENPLFFADRYVHLFLNSYSGIVDEVDFLFDQFTFRLQQRLQNQKNDNHYQDLMGMISHYIESKRNSV